MNVDEPTRAGGGRTEPPPQTPGTAAPPTALPPAPSPLDAETARAVDEARRAFLFAAEKAGIAARALSSQVRAGAAEAIEELAAIARAAHERVRDMAADAGALAPPGDATRPGSAPPSPSATGDGQAGPLHPPAPPPAADSAVGRGSASSASRLEPRLAGALAYAGWAMTGILFYLLTDRTERFVRFHALQSILLTAALAIVGGSVLAVPLIGKALFATAAIGFFLVWLLAMRRAFRHERYPLPFIGEIARAHVDRHTDAGWQEGW